MANDGDHRKHSFGFGSFPIDVVLGQLGRGQHPGAALDHAFQREQPLRRHPNRRLLECTQGDDALSGDRVIFVWCIQEKPSGSRSESNDFCMSVSLLMKRAEEEIRIVYISCPVRRISSAEEERNDYQTWARRLNIASASCHAR